MRTVVVTDPPRADVDDADDARGATAWRPCTRRSAGPATSARSSGRRGRARGSAARRSPCCAGPGDNLMIHVAVEQCRPGDVLVVATNSPSTDGLFGELFATALAQRGVRGVVLASGVRDVADLREMGFPAWSRAVSAQGTVKATAGAVNVPVVLGGQTVHPGDVVRRRRRRRRGRAARRRRPGAGRVRGPRWRRRRPPAPRSRTASWASTATACAAGSPSSASSTCRYEEYWKEDDGELTSVRRHRRPLHDAARRHLARAATSRPRDLPADPAARDDLLLRLMGTPDPRQIDGLGGATSLTSKVAVVGPSEHPDADVDYLFLQLGVDEADVSATGRTAATSWPGSGPFAVERGLVPAGATARPTSASAWSTPTASPSPPFPTPDGRVAYRGDVAIAGVPGTAAPVVTLAFTDTEGSATGRLLPTGNVRDTDRRRSRSPASTTACRWSSRSPTSFGLTGHETPRAARRRPGARWSGSTPCGSKAGAADGPRRRRRVVGAQDRAARRRPRDGGQVATRSFIPVQPHTAIGVLGRGQRGHRDAAARRRRARARGRAGRRPARQVDVEHPTGHLLVDVVVDTTTAPPRVTRSGVVRTARKLFDGTAFPRPAS